MAAGQPSIFKTAADLQKKIEEYIESVSAKVIKNADQEDEEIFYGKPVTISGLAYYLGFESRQSFYDYEKREEFSYTIKRARLFIESQYEERLAQRHCTGAIFALKNLGWDDKRQIKHEGIPDTKVVYLVAPEISADE